MQGPAKRFRSANVSGAGGMPKSPNTSASEVFFCYLSVPRFLLLIAGACLNCAANLLNMSQSELISLFAMASPPQPGQPQPPFWTNLVVPGLLMVVFYFVLIRPQQRKAKDHAMLLKAVRAGDRVITTSGIVGVVLSVKEKTLSIRSADSKFEITKSAIAEISERTGEPTES